MAKKVIKADKADEKVEQLTKKDAPGKKHRSAAEIREKLYAKKDK